MKRVIVAGSGFGGVKAALLLAKQPNTEVRLISDRDCFEYHAALYRTSTGRSQLEVSIQLTEIFAHSKAEIINDRVEVLDSSAKHISGQSGTKYHYDSLILALGSVTEYYGIKGLPDYSYGIKSDEEAMRLKNHLHHELTAGQHGAELNYVVVGGGPTGVELAGELIFYLHRIRQRHGITRHFNVQVVEAAPRLLPTLPEDISRKAEKRLKKLGIKIFTSTAVKAETASALKLPEGSIETHTVIWTAGVTNNPFFSANAKLFTLGKGKRVEVDGQLLGAPHAYVIGDSAATAQSGWAQTAIYDAGFVAQILGGAKPKAYHPPKPVGAIPIGPKWCLVASDHRRLSGYPGWLVRRWLDLKLYSNVLPPMLALKTWASGTKHEETCPECR